MLSAGKELLASLQASFHREFEQCQVLAPCSEALLCTRIISAPHAPCHALPPHGVKRAHHGLCGRTQGYGEKIMALDVQLTDTKERLAAGAHVPARSAELHRACLRQSTILSGSLPAQTGESGV